MAVGLSSLIAGAVTNPVTYDLLKLLGARALARLKDRGIRTAVLRDTRDRLVRYGFPTEQAEHLAQLVDDKRWLERGASLDVVVLSQLVQTEMKERGYLPLEGDFLYRCLVESVASAVGGNAFTASMVAALFLERHPQPINPAPLLTFVNAMRHPEKLGAELLASILSDAGQTEARLAVNHRQELELVGPYQLHLKAHGEAGTLLRDAVQRALDGEQVVIDSTHTTDITLTAGHEVLDRVLGLLPGEFELRLGPVYPKRALRIRGLHGAESRITVEVQRQRDEGLTLVFVDRPALVFKIIMTPTSWRWQFHFDLVEASITPADRNTLLGIRLLTGGRAQVFDAQTDRHLFTFREGGSEIRAVHVSTGLLMDLLDLDRFLEALLGERVGFEMGEPLTARLVERVALAARHARRDLVGDRITHTHPFALTDDWAEFFGPGQNYWIAITHPLPHKCADLALTLEWRAPKVTFKDARGRRLARADLKRHVGEVVHVTLSGTVVDAAIHRAEADEVESGLERSERPER